MTVNLAVDYVVYPAVVGAIGLVVAGAVKVLKGVNWDKVPSWPLLLALGGPCIGFAWSDMPDNREYTLPRPPTMGITGDDSTSVGRKAELAKMHYDYLDKHPWQCPPAQPRLLPAAADGAILAGGIALCVIGLILAVSQCICWLNAPIR